MSTITPSTTYPDGSAISVAGHNANLYSTTVGEGVMSEPNGGLDNANRDPAFTLLGEHVMPEEATIARMDGTTLPTDIFSDAFGQRGDDTDPTYVPLAGLCERVYLPYNVSCLLWQWSFFVVPSRPWMYNALIDQGDIPKLVLRVFFDDVEVPALRRYLPPTTFAWEYSDISGLDDHEQLGQLWFDLARLQHDVSRGFHTLTVKLFLPRIGDLGDSTETDEARTAVSMVEFVPGYSDATERVSCYLRQRITLGTRNVRCVAFK